MLGNNDHTVNPELQHFVSELMGATVYAVDSSHVPMLSHPDVVLDAIGAAANAVETSERSGERLNRAVPLR